MTRQESLAELSARLGFEVHDVKRTSDDQWLWSIACTPAECYCRLALPTVERRARPRGWMPPFPHQRWVTVGKSAVLRNPATLNKRAGWYGRPSDLPRLVAEDGRRAVRLSFDVVAPR